MDNTGTGINEVVQRLKAGDMVSAAEWNKVADFISRASQINKSEDAIYTGCGEFVIPKPNYFNIYNGDGTTIPSYGVCLRNGVTTTAAIPIPQVKRPDTYGCQQNFIINDQAEIPATVFGQGQVPVNNLYIAAYDSASGTPAKGEMWGTKSGTYLLTKNYGGFVVEGIYDGTNHYALVRSVPMTTVRGKVTPSDLASGTSGTLVIYVGAYGSETQPTGNPTITNVRNDSSCVVKANKMARAMINPDINVSGNPWQFTDAYTQ